MERVIDLLNIGYSSAINCDCLIKQSDFIKYRFYTDKKFNSDETKYREFFASTQDFDKFNCDCVDDYESGCWDVGENYGLW